MTDPQSLTVVGWLLWILFAIALGFGWALGVIAARRLARVRDPQ